MSSFRNFYDEKINFGKFKGQKFSEIPLSYLEWIASQPPVPNLKIIPHIEKSKKKIRKWILYEKRHQSEKKNVN